MRKNKILEYFRIVTDNEDTGRVKYVCLFCDTTYTCKNVTRFVRHITVNCNKTPLEVKRDFGKNESENTSNNGAIQSTIADGPTAVERGKNTFNAKEADKAFARAVHVTGQPLSIFEHPLWKQVFQLLRPEYSPPSRKTLSTVLTDEEYKDIKRKVTEKHTKRYE